MKRLRDPARVRRQIEHAIDTFDLDLTGMAVLTEAASGSFVVTPLIAALAGSEHVIAVTKDSAYGRAEDIRSYTESWASAFGVAPSVVVSEQPSWTHAPDVNVVTNLGFVRPIDARLVSRLPLDAAVCLMWETWEHRPADVDLEACRRRGVPVLGTRETDPRLRTFRYVGVLALKLLLNAGIEVFGSRVVVVGDGEFADEVREVLAALECDVIPMAAASAASPSPAEVATVNQSDAVVLAEHRSREPLVGGAGLPAPGLAEGGVVLVHISGVVDHDELAFWHVEKHPPNRVEPGTMTMTTGEVGSKPVVGLHAAGLRVGQMLVDGMRTCGDPVAAEAHALERSPAMGWD